MKKILTILSIILISTYIYAGQGNEVSENNTQTQQSNNTQSSTQSTSQNNTQQPNTENKNFSFFGAYFGLGISEIAVTYADGSIETSKPDYKPIPALMGGIRGIHLFSKHIGLTASMYYERIGGSINDNQEIYHYLGIDILFTARFNNIFLSCGFGFLFLLTSPSADEFLTPEVKNKIQGTRNIFIAEAGYFFTGKIKFYVGLQFKIDLYPFTQMTGTVPSGEGYDFHFRHFAVYVITGIGF